ncbi:type VI secretion system-associated protein TagC-5, partial [Burkholderia pseudomallei]
MIHGSRTSMTPPPSSSAPLGAAAPLPPVHARRADEAGAALRAARVTGRVGDWLLLDDHAGRARRADGCLLAPDIGDSVLIWTSAPAGALADDDDAAHAPSAYVLAVLARAGAP